MTTPSTIGVCVIGRNEAKHLASSLDSILAQNDRVVYVDSGSTDASVEIAGGRKVPVIELDASSMLSAARARNTGFAALRSRYPDIELVQFVDGDCTLVDGWLNEAGAAMVANPDTAIVFGQLRERDTSTVFNRLCNIEWHSPPGEVAACGGIFMVRGDAFESAGGFNTQLKAGEEPELCLRLRQAGHRIVCLPAPMAVHDADLTRFGLWWRRMVRAGQAYAQGAWLHGRNAERFGVRESLSALFFGGVLPIVSLIAMAYAGPVAALILLVYPAQVLRIALRHTEPKLGLSDRMALGLFTVLGKFAECQGQIGFWLGGRTGTGRP